MLNSGVTCICWSMFLSWTRNSLASLALSETPFRAWESWHCRKQKKKNIRTSATIPKLIVPDATLKSQDILLSWLEQNRNCRETTIWNQKLENSKCCRSISSELLLIWHLNNLLHMIRCYCMDEAESRPLSCEDKPVKPVTQRGFFPKTSVT